MVAAIPISVFGGDYIDILIDGRRMARIKAV
jgi:hypothetical protein